MIKKYWFLFIIPFVFILLPSKADALSNSAIQIIASSTTDGDIICDNWYNCTLPLNNINRVSIRYSDYSLSEGGKYELYTTIEIGKYVDNFPIRDGFYIGNYQRNAWNNASTVTWNNIDNHYYDNGFECYVFQWGLVQKVTSTINSNGITFDFYFTSPQNLSHIIVQRFDLINTGNTTTDAINNSANNIISSNGANTDKIIESNKETQDKIDKTNDLIEDDKIGDAQEKADDFFGNFESDDFGLSDIITLPLTFIQGLSSATCYNLELPLPFVDTNVTLPCMTSIYQTYFGGFLTLYQTITTGFIAYWVCINIFRLVQGFKNPDNNEIEVMEL